MPAPMGGMNTSVPLSQMDPSQTIYTYNMRSTSYGLGLRPGYKEWCEPVPLGDGVKTIIAVNGIAGSHIDDRALAITSDGVYDITTQFGTPTKELDWPVKNADTGWCSWLHFTPITGSGKAFIAACDLSNGYYLYDVALNTWAIVNAGVAAGEINGADPRKFAFITVWKNRLWFVEKDSTVSWYLPVGQLTGTVVKFDWGPKLRTGGFLKGIYNWTLNGGLGVDDYLVGIGSEGDVLVYQGADPSDGVSFELHGTWQIGKQPRNKRVATEFGGDLLVASQYGILPMSRMVSGLPLDEESTYVTQQINSLYRVAFQDRIDAFGFEIKNMFALGGIYVIWPKVPGKQDVQLFYSLATKSWTVWTGIPALTSESCFGKSYIGTLDNRIFTLEGGLDNDRIDPLFEPTAIPFSVLTAFSDLQAPATFKQMQLFRPLFIGDAPPAYSLDARYDYDISDANNVPVSTDVTPGLWNIALWDVDVWGGGFVPNQPLRGAYGMGRTVAMVLRGNANSTSLILTGFDYLYSSGGLL